MPPGRFRKRVAAASLAAFIGMSAFSAKAPQIRPELSHPHNAPIRISQNTTRAISGAAKKTLPYLPAAASVAATAYTLANRRKSRGERFAAIGESAGAFIPAIGAATSIARMGAEHVQNRKAGRKAAIRGAASNASAQLRSDLATRFRDFRRKQAR